MEQWAHASYLYQCQGGFEKALAWVEAWGKGSKRRHEFYYTSGRRPIWFRFGRLEIPKLSLRFLECVATPTSFSPQYSNRRHPPRCNIEDCFLVSRPVPHCRGVSPRPGLLFWVWLDWRVSWLEGYCLLLSPAQPKRRYGMVEWPACRTCRPKAFSSSHYHQSSRWFQDFSSCSFRSPVLNATGYSSLILRG